MTDVGLIYSKTPIPPATLLKVCPGTCAVQSVSSTLLGASTLPTTAVGILSFLLPSVLAFSFHKGRVSIIKVEDFGNTIILGWSAHIYFEPHGPFLAGHTDSPPELG